MPILKRFFLRLMDLFFYYGSALFGCLGFVLLFAFLIGTNREDFLEKKWWLVAAISLLVSGYKMMNRSQDWRDQRLRHEVERMFRQAKKARKNAHKK